MQKSYPVYHKIRAVAKMLNTQQSGTVRAVTDKDFAIAKKKWRICKHITILCVHAEKSVFVKKPLKYVWCGLEIYFICRVCIDSNKKPITLHLNTMQVSGVGKQ